MSWKIEPTIFSTFDAARNSIATYRPVATPEDDGTDNGWTVLVRADRLDVAKRIVRAVNALTAYDRVRIAATDLLLREDMEKSGRISDTGARRERKELDSALIALDAILEQLDLLEQGQEEK